MTIDDRHMYKTKLFAPFLCYKMIDKSDNLLVSIYSRKATCTTSYFVVAVVNGTLCLVMDKG